MWWLRGNFDLKILIFLLLVVPTLVNAVKYGKKHDKKQALKFLENRGKSNKRNTHSSNQGLFPKSFNLAKKAFISANATCGSKNREEFCRLSESGKPRCGVCDDFSLDSGKKHSINFAIDGSNRWWQSPALSYGSEYEFVTVTVDLKQIYQISDIILKSATSPRPGSWILEKSLDGENFVPWQYFARNDLECLERFGVPATKGRPHYFTDSEVICTSFHSKLIPLENGEVHTSLIKGRPGASELSPELLEFTKARFVRFRFVGLRGTQEPLPKWMKEDMWLSKKLFYTIRDIMIGGQCVCNGHAENCRHNVASGHPECECSHHTCGPNCEKCCPLFNQRKWAPGSSRDGHHCLPCNCHGHADSCHYDEEADKARLSLDTAGHYSGGGICDNCTHHTTGINCDKCIDGYYRPLGTPPDSPTPCLSCDCYPGGAEHPQICIPNGELAGLCICKPGYTGIHCDACSPGFRGFPDCEPCPCDPKGLVEVTECEDDCYCKANVEGKYCDRCKPGYFGLSSMNPEGCLPCFCSGVTTLCELAVVKNQTINSKENWLITDLKVTETVKPRTQGDTIYLETENPFSGVENFYWLAPKEYLGNKLEAYGSNFIFKVQWDILRGDTSGEPTKGPKMVIEGSNGIKIGYGDDTYHSQVVTFQIPLTENHWYHIPTNLTDISTRTRKSDYNIGYITRAEFLTVLTDIKYVLLRGSFHTDQSEAMLASAMMNYGNENENYELGRVEKCSCPSGYGGLSCEKCSFGHVRIYPNSTSLESFCASCDCNGHSETCDALTGECFCQHNTIGAQCERCAPGYYGNPLRGTSTDCKPCACPLENEENNFSPACQLDLLTENNIDGGSYVCTQCPGGYTGDHCEICDDRFYGDPTEVGNKCTPCDCNGGPCDRRTGQCLSCKGNTEGWKCEKCKPDHYGDPSTFNCKSCECDAIGSHSKQCDTITGQCSCKEKFTGRTCDKCEPGYGNVTASCPACSCSLIGSKSAICNSHTGICDCQPGVDGFHCDACQNLHFGFSSEGCKACDCDPNGSKYSSCDPVTGNCVCKNHYEGRTCSSCKNGYWKNVKKDCIKCHCNEYGATDSFCDQEIGQCTCVPGVTGQSCDQCLPNYYGNVETGCVECEPCTKKGHVCGKGGKCVCPELTIGKECERCALNSWGYDSVKGCQHCNCSTTGSLFHQCDKLSGACQCKNGFHGPQCDECAFGYYGYPNCRQCLCNELGTLESQCRDGSCMCNKDGSCICKENVTGPKCSTCKNTTFGLTKENPQGCTECFCFGRSNKCMDTRYNWEKIRFEKEIPDENHEPVSSDTISLPKAFMGDLTNSYDGYLSVNGNGGKFSAFLTGNQISLRSDISTNELKLSEKFWIVTSGRILPSCDVTLTRECLMLVLQNVSSFIIQGENMEISEVLLDSARPYIPYNRTSHSIEQCICPPEYTGLSCQDPNEGYYRYVPGSDEATQTVWIDSVIGIAKRCDCSGKSDKCDPHTGYCLDCSQHTAGSHCELCDTGFYKSSSGECLACHCPTEQENNAESCAVTKYGFSCQCKIGYTGANCAQCTDSYYRDSYTNECVPCNCNEFGSYSNLCNVNGSCQCRSGFEGRKCNQCRNPREFIKDGVCTQCDECTQLLFHDVDKLILAIEDAFDLFKDGLNPPWKILETLKKKQQSLAKSFNHKFEKAKYLVSHGNVSQIQEKAYEMQERADLFDEKAEKYATKSAHIETSAKQLLEDVKNVKQKIEEITNNLNNFGKQSVDTKSALKKGHKILGAIQEMVDVIQAQEEFDKRIFAYCDRVNFLVDEIYKPPPTLPYEQLEKFKHRLDDIEKLTSQIEENISLVDFQNSQNIVSITNLKRKIDEGNKVKELNEINMAEISDKVKNIGETISELEKNHEDMRNLDFSIFETIKEKLNEMREQTDDLDELYLEASEHIDDLERTVEKYQNTFNFTKDEWKTIKATGAYEEIVTKIKEAEDMANEARNSLVEAMNILDPKSSDKLIDKANLAHARSDRLKHRIVNLKNISNSFNTIKNKLEDFKYQILESGKANNDLNQILHNLEYQMTSQPETVTKLYEVIENSSDISERMRLLDKDIGNLNLTSRYDMFKQYELYLNMTSDEEVAKMNDNITNTKKLLNHISKQLDHLEIKEPKEWGDSARMQNLNSIASKIRELQGKISFAKQVTDSINIAIGLSNCSMFYNLPQTEVLRTLFITFKCLNCHLLTWESPQGVLSVKIKNGRAILTLDHGEPFELTSIKEEMVKSERTLLIERTGPLLRMKFDQEIGWRKLQIGSKLLVIGSNDYLQLGDGLPSQSNAYIYNLRINDYEVGLWKFTRTSGNCLGQSRVASLERLGTRTFYSGMGYQMYGMAPRTTPAKFNIQFDFATFDDNSLIYLAQEIENPCAFLALSLENGRLKFDIRHNNGKRVSLLTEKTFNDGKNYCVDLAMAFSNRKQHYSLKTDFTTNSANEKLDNKAVFRIKRATHFLGGISPILRTQCSNIQEHRSFVGLLNTDQFSNLTVSSGVLDTKGDLQLDKAWFYGNGSLILNTPLPLMKGSQRLESISFILRPLTAYTAIMDVQNLGVISLSNKQLHIDLKRESYSSKKSVDINDYNLVSVTFKKDKVTLAINGEDEVFYRNKSEGGQKMESLEMVLGSAPNYNKFSGGISDVMVNNERVPFSAKTVTAFSNVDIGRELPLIRKTLTLKGLVSPPSTTVQTNNMTNTMQNTERCSAIANYETDPTAVKLGDRPHSYIQIKSAFWKKDFKMEFQFRTFYPNGVLFISVGSTTQPHFNFLELRNGQVFFYVKGRRKVQKNWPITFSKKVNDGDWHSVKIVKKNNKKIHVSLDGEGRKKFQRLPKNLVRSEVFFGGVPPNYTDIKELKERLLPFRGCIKGLLLNEEFKLLGKNTKDVIYQNPTQCFPKVEEGAYFGGDAYAVYKQSFQVNKILDLSFQFKTPEQNGIFLSVSNLDNYPSWSIELQNGAVVMTVNLGNGATSHVKNNLDSDFALCNNMWHNVTAIYSSSELTVLVDGIRKSWVQSDVNNMIEEIDAALYVGGLPDDAPIGTIKMRENFKGCMKNLKIGNEPRDWSSMDELNNVLLNSCPVTTPPVDVITGDSSSSRSL